MFKIVFIVLMLFSHVGFAKGEKVGAGIVLGSYTGISGIYKNSNKDAYDGSLAFSLSNHRKFLIHAGKLFIKPKSLLITGQVHDWYYGLGARYIMLDRDNHDDDYRIGPRASIGIRYMFDQVPLDIIAEGAFIFNILPATNADVDILLGVRYYF